MKNEHLKLIIEEFIANHYLLEQCEKWHDNKNYQCHKNNEYILIKRFEQYADITFKDACHILFKTYFQRMEEE